MTPRARFGIPGAEAEALVHDIFASHFANPVVVAHRDLRAYFMGAVWNATRQYWRQHDHEEPLESTTDPVPTSPNA